MTSQGLLREARAVVFMVAALSVSVALHSWAGGALPPVLAILAGGGLVGLSAVLLAGRERGFPVIAALLLVAQGGLHELFSIVPPAGGHAMAMAPAHAGGAMLLAHLIAWVATAGWLYAGEVALWRLVRWVARRIPSLGALFALLGPVALPRAPRAGRGWLAERRVPLPVPAWWGRVLRRGPPALLAGTR